MPSQADIARHLGISRERVGQLTQEGMPTNSIKAAERWREQRAKKRAPTNGTRKFAGGKKGRPRKKKAVPRTGDTLYDALQAAIFIQEEAFEMLQDSMHAGIDEQISVRLSVHNKAIEARYKAEEMYRAELERREILIPYTRAAEEFRRGFEFLINRLRRAPQSWASQCNRQAPLEAYTVLEREVNMLLAGAQKEYAPFMPAEPKKSPTPNAKPPDPAKTTDQ